MEFRFATAGLLALSLTACATMPGETARTAAPSAETFEAAPVSQLVDAVSIPFETFELDNGLKVIVHTDRKAPVVGVTTYYRVGSKHEPRGRTGFAHLFEHIMFTGSENVENFDIPLEAAGSTGTNGSTNPDRTNYVETVPTGAVDLALMMESDRMGHLLGAVNQDKLDKQRGVVKNEKNQGDSQPYGLTRYLISEGLLPIGHPYRHSTIGSMADLDAASVTDVRKWFIDNYGPNNVVLALTGDIDVSTAREKVQRWFGHIPRGPEVVQPRAEPVTLASPVSREHVDQVPLVRLYRLWSGPGLQSPDSAPLTAGLSVFGGLASSRLDKVLVREEQLAVRVSSFYDQDEQLGTAYVTMDVKPGVDRAVAEARLDALIADYVANGPTADELKRAATQIVSGQIDGLEQVGDFGGKGVTLAEGLLYAGDAGFYKRQLSAIAAVTPDSVRGAMQRWLTRPVYKLAITPGPRTEKGADMGGWGDEGTVPPPKPDAKLPAPPLVTGPPRPMPPVGLVKPLVFPAVERAKLSNGITVALARRTAIPKVTMALEFDAGSAADGAAKAGRQAMMMDLLKEATTTRTAQQIAEEEERLGANVNAVTGRDVSAVQMTALTANLAPSLALMADIVRNPAFADEDVVRVRNQRLASIKQAMASPQGIATRALDPIIYGSAHPYGSVGALGSEQVVQAITPAALRSEHANWIRPEGAAITVVGDVTMGDLLPKLEAAFGNWKGDSAYLPMKDLTVAVPAPQPRIVLIDRPSSPSSMLLFGRVLPLTGTTQDTEALDLANEVIGSGFLSRLNMDLRETKGWTYGIGTGLTGVVGPRAAVVQTLVQADRTGDSIKAIFEQMRAFPKAKGVDAVELQRVTEGNIANLPTRYQTNASVLSAMLTNRRFGRPDDYQSRLADIWRGVDAAAINAAAAQYLQPDDMVVIVVGDRKAIEGQLTGLGLPIEYRDPQ
ncbi:Peptidase M16 inactive domain protein [Tsuneonella dongtanensis]|uniref:Peptidase M16 inactive domain protein n=1 Tax=Tsuneonella dongtanensis TaxID=692370 RepID=A0A1B2AH23_9SPHN|nr:pitrilysin family protein [Tsuneonella dongtanensis]ANY21335.1 Peptidase M16 inactive domain protein [Tsuneonella dongtanensis]